MGAAEAKHLLFIVTSSLIGSELNIGGGGADKNTQSYFFIGLDGNCFLLFFFQCLGIVAVCFKEQYTVEVSL